MPEFAVPTRIEFSDPHSGRRYSCTVIRDDTKNRFVAYVGCRSSHGSFDFQLQVNYHIDRGNFRVEDYTDEHTTRQDARIPSYEDMLRPDHRMAVAHFFSQESGPPQASPNVERQIPLFQPQKPNLRVKSQESKSKRPEKLPAKRSDWSRYFDAANLTKNQREVASLKLEYEMTVAQIARQLKLHRSTVDEHLATAKKKIEHGRSFEKRAAKRSTNPE
jgi:DNA-binding CsgD family transcriptional regulator